jgi:ATP-dependent DNA helicase RecG
VPPITSLRGAGGQTERKLARLGLHTVQDILFHLPLRYEDRTQVQALALLKPGEECLAQGVIEASEVRNGKRRMLLCLINDGTAKLMLRFFHFYPGQQQQLQPGVTVRCFGEVRQGYDCLEMTHPEYRRIDPQQPPPAETSLTPVYPSTEGLPQAVLRRLTEQALEFMPPELLPETLLRRYHLPPLAGALRTLHRPPAGTLPGTLEKNPARLRLAFEELLAHRLSLRLLRNQTRQRSAPALAASGEWQNRLLASLPFQLTPAQQRVIAEISQDLAQPIPMLRLVQGDVGSGKTIVAALAALQAAEAGWQAAVMAPTELLAEQHLRNFSHWLEPLDIPVAWLAGSISKKRRAAALERLNMGQPALAVGTHALFQEGVQFNRLGLVIVDEQHRFGVHQRLALRDKGSQDGLLPHQLIMTATPIPRTLAMTAYADLDVSVIDELPPGRSPVTTVVIPDSRRSDVVQRVAAACRENRQAYWVCPFIEESETLQCQAAENTATDLRGELPELRIGLLHGRLKAKEKEAIMRDFQEHRLDLLVATTVIEVGVDVPNASLMIIENAERMGLAQLHQLRGRVGRGSRESHCVLLFQGKLSETARLRLGVIRDTQDGFVIAQRDLEIRGPGEVLGTRQTGEMQFRLVNLTVDQAMLQTAAEAAELLLRDFPGYVQPLLKRWVRHGLSYGEV